MKAEFFWIPLAGRTPLFWKQWPPIYPVIGATAFFLCDLSARPFWGRLGAMAKDRVHPLKLEDPASGGVETDEFPTSLDQNEDFVDARGVTFQNATSDDEAVVAERDAENNLVLTDPVAGSWKLSELGGGGLTESAHRIVRQLIHFIDEGPAEGFATNAYREVTGSLFPSAFIWWESSAKLKKIVSREVTWTGPFPATVIWKIYDTDGSTVLATVTDTLTYSGPFETSRTRAIVVV